MTALFCLAGLPVVCFSMTGSLGAYWVDRWPGLAKKLTPPASGAPIAVRPDIFSLQVWTDPYSNCLTPRLGDDPSRLWAASVCSFPGPPPACAPPVNLSYVFNSPCVVGTHLQQNIIGYVPRQFNAIACSDLCEASVAVCENLPPAPPAPAAFNCPAAGAVVQEPHGEGISPSPAP